MGAESRHGSGTCGMACFKHYEERECLVVTGKMLWFVHAIKVLNLLKAVLFLHSPRETVGLEDQGKVVTYRL